MFGCVNAVFVVARRTRLGDAPPFAPSARRRVLSGQEFIYQMARKRAKAKKNRVR